MANALVVSSMDSATSEDGSISEQITEELIVCADQRMSICMSISWSTQHTDKFDRILLNGCSLYPASVMHHPVFFGILGFPSPPSLKSPITIFFLIAVCSRE